MILFDHVTKRYGKGTRAVLDDISLHISANEFVFLVGKSGAGKSTLLKMITKEATPDSGKIIIGGIDLDYVKRRHIPDYRRRIGVVFQDYKLLPSFSSWPLWWGKTACLDCSLCRSSTKNPHRRWADW